MLSTRSARTLLANAGTGEGLLTLARALGFIGQAHRLSERPLATLGLGTSPGMQATRVVRDADSACLLVDGLDPRHWRDSLQRLATRLDRLADHRRWLLCLRCTGDGPLVLATWLSSSHGPRLSVLTTAPSRVLDSDAQTVAALSAAWHPDPTLTCLRWHDLLGRHAIGRRFFRALEAHVTQIADAWPTRVLDEDRRTLALIHVARLLFLKFLETKGWLDDDRGFLARHTESALADGGRVWERVLAPLTFGTLNTPPSRRAPASRQFGAIPFLNGGLFATSGIERRTRHPRIHDDLLAPLLLDTLARYRFTAREEARSWQEAAIDPDLLGRTFESLMDGAERKGSGTFYTPAALVNSLVDDALCHGLATGHALTRGALDGVPLSARDRAALAQTITRTRVLDPACGSGSLLVAMLERLAALLQHTGDQRPITAIRRDVLVSSIFGVDIAPIAVWLCELRLWLSVVIDDDSTDPRSIVPLPNLDHHIRIGDSLGAQSLESAVLPRSAVLADLRRRYASSSGTRKRTLATRVDALERASARHLLDRRAASLTQTRTELLRLARARTLFGGRRGLSAEERRRLASVRNEIHEVRRRRRRIDDGAALDFDFRSHFADATADGGFDIVIGNPPWVRPHHLDLQTRAHLRAHFRAVTRHAGEAMPFGVQTDLAIPFTARALALTRHAGVLAFLLPAKLWRSVAGGALRELLQRDTALLDLKDHSADAGGFAAAVYPSAIVARRMTPDRDATAMRRTLISCQTADAQGEIHQFRIAGSALPATPDPGAPWRIVPDAVREAADALTHPTVRWLDTPLPTPTLGVKTGCNDAFLVSEHDAAHALRAWTRPALRGDHVRAWHSPTSRLHLVVPYDADGRPVPRLTSVLRQHFAPHERLLHARTDLRPRDPWWTLFRTDLLADHDWRVVWADIGRAIRATVLPPGCTTVPLNTCYGVRLRDPIDAHALAALLNAPTTTAWLSLIAEPARGGYHRFLGWTVLALPMPHWDRARRVLAPLTARTRRGEPLSVAALHRATLDAYGIQHQRIVPLLEWAGSDRLRARTARRHSA